MSEIKIKPARKGLRVRKPAGGDLHQHGETVELDRFWQHRLEQGRVVTMVHGDKGRVKAYAADHKDDPIVHVGTGATRAAEEKERMAAIAKKAKADEARAKRAAAKAKKAAEADTTPDGEG
jgi:hypothetical protein